MVTHGHAAPLAGIALARAVKLSEHLPSTKQRLDAQLGLSSHLSLSGELPRALGLAEEMLAAGEAPQCRLAGLRARGIVHFLSGRFDDSIDDLQQFVSLWHSGQPVEGLGLAHDPGSVTVHCYRSYSLTFAGRIAEARRHVAAAMQGARASGHHLIVAQAMFTEAVLAYHTGAAEDARLLLERTLAYALEHGVVYFKMFASTCLSSIEGRMDEVKGALQRIGKDIDFARDSGTYAYLPGFLAREGELLVLAGRIPEALTRFAEAFALTEQTSSRWDEARNRRLFAKVLVADGRTAEAQAELRRALVVARRQRARLFELEIACDFAPMLSAKGHPIEACDLLQSCLASFAEEDTVAIMVRARNIIRKIGYSRA
jgi:tetratricopeptide (TPR) repeat protein